LHEQCDARRKLLREFPTVDDLVVVAILEVEVVTAERAGAGDLADFAVPLRQPDLVLIEGPVRR